jgi:pSer/pThr/pTyr-binding forkhead associated (FHA) protein
MSIEFVWYLKGDEGGSSRQQRRFEGSGPFTIGRSNACDIVIADTGVSRRHATVTFRGDNIEIADAETPNGTRLDGQPITTAIWPRGKKVEIGDYVIEASSLEGEAARTEVTVPPTSGDFPPAEFKREKVSVKALSALGLPVEEVEYLTLGGGIGSFVWADHLRVFGVAADNIRAIGVDPVPYGKYERLCRYSQIPLHERLRSNSISTPDNIWGFPGYASREAWRELSSGKLGGLKHVLQVFAEPALSESYTPRAGDVFKSMDREAKRIGWERIWMPGRIMAVRKTDDGRYAVAYRVPADLAKSGPRNRVVVASYLHIAMGYPASRYLDDLQEFKRRHPRSQRVINAYEQHDTIYEDLEANGGIVLLRGRGIVASRILQRLYEARAKNKEIRVLHVMRSRIETGRSYDLARRLAVHDFEYQPFNWPKSCWGGPLRQQLERADDAERIRLLQKWGGTTTADRGDWDEIIVQGKREGWYKPFFGVVERIELRGDKLISELESSQAFREEVRLQADYIVDCTGLIAELDANPVLRDLIETYRLPRNRASGRGAEQRLSGIKVTNDFEIEGLRNGSGRVYAAGVITLNGPYAAVDSFLGLQYAALRSVDHLAAEQAPAVSAMGPMRSARQWLKWCRGEAP